MAAQCDLCNFGYEYEHPIELRVQLGTAFHGCISNLVDKIAIFSNTVFDFILSPERLVPLQSLIETWESLPNPDWVNVIGSALKILCFDLQPFLEIIVPSAIKHTPINVNDLVDYFLNSIPPGTETIDVGLGIQLLGAYTSQYFIQRITNLLNSLPALQSNCEC